MKSFRGNGCGILDSDVLLARFQIREKDGKYQILNVQQSDQKPGSADEAIMEALYCVRIVLD